MKIYNIVPLYSEPPQIRMTAGKLPTSLLKTKVIK